MKQEMNNQTQQRNANHQLHEFMNDKLQFESDPDTLNFYRLQNFENLLQIHLEQVCTNIHFQ